MSAESHGQLQKAINGRASASEGAMDKAVGPLMRFVMVPQTIVCLVLLLTSDQAFPLTFYMRVGGAVEVLGSLVRYRRDVTLLEPVRQTFSGIRKALADLEVDPSISASQRHEIEVMIRLVAKNMRDVNTSSTLLPYAAAARLAIPLAVTVWPMCLAYTPIILPVSVSRKLVSLASRARSLAR
jgi:hypothetical protein